MKHTHFVSSTAAFVVSSLGLTLAGCSGSSGTSGAGSSNSFRIDSVSILSGSTWQINREIEVRFSSDVDFTSVNLNTIQVGRVGGAHAAGEFRIGVTSDGSLDPRRILFAPRCPTLSDYSDAGLAPGGLAYLLNVVGGGGFTVKSMGGQSLERGQTVNFNTPNSSEASVLFVDTVPGPPAAIIRTTPSNLNASYLEVGGSTLVEDRQYFTARLPFDAALGATLEDPLFQAPLNLYSLVDSRVSVVLVLNQAVDPSSTNVNTDNIRMEYQEVAPGGSTSWIPLAHTVSLIANCTQTGALVRVSPTGILPQARVVRIVFSSGLRDVVGAGNLVDIVVGSFSVGSNVDQSVDEFREEFTTTAAADQVSQSTNPAAPRAQWGTNPDFAGTLSPNFDFSGTGGPPDGRFDYEVGSSVPGTPPESPIIDTTYTLITDTTQTRIQPVINGVMDVRNFTINVGSKVTVLGPNVLKIYASGNVRILGQLLLRGTNNHGVATLGTACQPEAGATGNAGGGKGGTASYLTTQSTPKGEDGYGPFDQASGGGGGGHTAYKYPPGESIIGEKRRPGGGGGGRLGADVMETARPICPDQSFIGLDVEAGFPGTPGANDALLGANVKPVGGPKGPGPFSDSATDNNFFGLKVLTPTGISIQGELSGPSAGAGGGAGGDTCTSFTFPTNPFSCQGDEKGAGGGGGGGGIMILALGDIVFGAKGRIDASGGTGGGGENSASGVGIQRIGGGSGGGSGGHIILQSASKINLAACVAPDGGIFALGGEGGAGKNDAGGAQSPGNPTDVSLDALPSNSYPSTAPLTPCKITTTTNSGTFIYPFTNTVGNMPPGGVTNDNDPLNVVTCAGGDGGPGIVQLHVQRLSNTQALSDLILPIGAANPMRLIVQPTPVGATPANLQTPGLWDQMVPQFGRFSTGLSKWIPLGSAGITSSGQKAVQFGLDASLPVEDQFHAGFGGTDTTSGFVNAASGSVTQLAPILFGTLASAPTLPYVTADYRTIVFDPTGLDPIYTQNPNLMLRFGMNVTLGSTSQFEVVAASYSAGQLRLSVATTGSPLQPLATGSVEVIPRFFRVITNSAKDALPSSATIRVRFQAAPADSAGKPIIDPPPASPPWVLATDFVNDPAVIQNHPNATNFKFVRFRVDFDILADGSVLTFSTPRPTVDFLRLPFKF